MHNKPNQQTGTQESIYRKIRITNSLDPRFSGKYYTFDFTKNQYYKYLLKSVSWQRVSKTILVIIGMVGLFTYGPIFLISGVLSLVIDGYAFIAKKFSWYLIFAYPLCYFVAESWHGIIYASFFFGILNLAIKPSFFKSPYEIDIDGIESQNKQVDKISTIG